MALMNTTQCSRCPRVESAEITIEEALELEKRKKSKATRVVEIHYEGKPVVAFESLCAQCRNAVARYIAQIAKELKHQSGKRDEAGNLLEETEVEVTE